MLLNPSVADNSWPALSKPGCARKFTVFKQHRHGVSVNAVATAAGP